MHTIRVLIIGMRVRIIGMVPIVRRGVLISHGLRDIHWDRAQCHTNRTSPARVRAAQPAPAAAADAVTQVQAGLPEIVMSPCADKAVHGALLDSQRLGRVVDCSAYI